MAYRSTYSEYGDSYRYGSNFGSGDPALTRDYQDKTTYGQALVQAWANGCPIPNRVTKQYGAEWARDRYQDTNEMYYWIDGILTIHQNDLHTELSIGESRIRGEDDPKLLIHEPENVPQSHLNVVAPLSHIKGYALSRILIEQRGRGKVKTEKRSNQLIPILNDVVPVSQNILELLARVSEAVIDRDADPKQVLHHLFSRGNLLEERTYSAFDHLASIVRDVAPNLWSFYQELSAEERKRLDLITFTKRRNPIRLSCKPE